MRRLLILFIMLIFLISLDGCSSSYKNDMDNKEKITLTMWHIWSQTSNDANGKIIQDTIEKWNKENPDVQIKVETVENERYKTKIKTAFAQMNCQIYFIPGVEALVNLYRIRKVLNLNQYMDDDTKIISTKRCLTM